MSLVLLNKEMNDPDFIYINRADTSKQINALYKVNKKDKSIIPLKEKTSTATQQGKILEYTLIDRETVLCYLPYRIYDSDLRAYFKHLNINYGYVGVHMTLFNITQLFTITHSSLYKLKSFFSSNNKWIIRDSQFLVEMIKGAYASILEAEEIIAKFDIFKDGSEYIDDEKYIEFKDRSLEHLNSASNVLNTFSNITPLYPPLQQLLSRHTIVNSAFLDLMLEISLALLVTDIHKYDKVIELYVNFLQKRFKHFRDFSYTDKTLTLKISDDINVNITTDSSYISGDINKLLASVQNTETDKNLNILVDIE